MSKELFTKLKELFSAVDAPVAPVVEPAQLAATTAKLSDGTEITYDKLEVGGVCATAAGPLAAGDYTLEDGTTVSVGEAGVITAVTPVQEMETETPVTPVTPPVTPAAVPPPPAQNYDEVIAGQEARIAALEAALATQKLESDKIQEAYTKQAEFSKVTIELLEQLIGAPSVEPPAQKRKFSFINNTEKKGLARFQAAAQKILEQKTA